MKYHPAVNLRSLILRLFLALALAANGIGSAFAATHMQISSVGAAAASIRMDDREAAEECDKHSGMDATALQDNSVPSDLPGNAGEESAGCCQAGLCACVCVMHAVAGMANNRVIETLIDRDTTAQVLSTGHMAPALPHLIRPPIG